MDILERVIAKKLYGGEGGGGTPANIQPLTVTENGTYNAGNGVNGYAPVTVNVSTGGGEDNSWIVGDGKTRLHISIATDGRMNVPLYIQQTVANGVAINWGDGSVVETIDGTGKVNTVHAYARPGDYVITLDVTDGYIRGFGADDTSLGVLGSTSDTGELYSTMLQKVEIGEGVASLGKNAFSNCYNLTGVKISEGITSISERAFMHCYGFSSIKIPEGVTSIERDAFGYCYGLASVEIPESVTSIGIQAFTNCSLLASIKIPEGVVSIGDYAFMTCYGLASIEIPESVTSIGIGAFANSYRVKSIEIPESVTSIGDSAFRAWYSLASVEIPESVTSIGKQAFYTCRSLKSLEIPKSVTSIGDSAFTNCCAMAYYDFTKHTAVPTLGSSAMKGIRSDCEIRVPAALAEEWKAATNWATYASRIVGV